MKTQKLLLSVFIAGILGSVSTTAVAGSTTVLVANQTQNITLLVCQSKLAGATLNSSTPTDLIPANCTVLNPNSPEASASYNSQTSANLSIPNGTNTIYYNIYAYRTYTQSSDSQQKTKATSFICSPKVLTNTGLQLSININQDNNKLTCLYNTASSPSDQYKDRKASEILGHSYQEYVDYTNHMIKASKQ